MKTRNEREVAHYRKAMRTGEALLRGMPVLLLHTTGRKSGTQRVNPMLYIRDGENYVVTASNGGSERPPAWLLNLEADGAVRVELPGGTIEANARRARAEEQARMWPQLVEQASFFNDYQNGTERVIPMVILEPQKV